MILSEVVVIWHLYKCFDVACETVEIERKYREVRSVILAKRFDCSRCEIPVHGFELLIFRTLGI